MYFDGDFSLLPLRASLDIGPVPQYPTSEDFQNAACRTAHADPFTWEGAAVHWYLEAVRERRNHPAAPLSGEHLAAITKRTAERLYTAQKAALNAGDS